MPMAARLLSLMSIFDRQRTPKSLLQQHYTANEGDEGRDTNSEEDMFTLSRISLVKTGAGGSELQMH